MSLRGRLLLVIVLLNLTVLGIVQTASAIVHQGILRDYRQVYQNHLQSVLSDAYETGNEGALQRVRRLLEPDSSIRRLFRDGLVTNGRDANAPGHVHLNLMGAVHRDSSFPVERVRLGIEAAMENGGLVEAGGGYCVPITGADEEIVAGAWYLPILSPMPQVPFRVFAIPFLVSTLLFAILAFMTINRSVVRPLNKLGGAASRLGGGKFDVRVQRVPRTPEFDVLVEAFNTMAMRIEGHTEDLEREVKSATEEARRKERALVVSGRLAAMGTLAAGVAHEINNPIGGMLNAVIRLSERKDLGDRERAYLELIREGLNRVSGTTQKFLDFSPRDLEPQPFLLRDAVDRARSLIDHRLREQSVEIHIEIAEELPDLVGDRHEIQQVLLNLFINSLDVLEGQKEGWIRVAARADEGFVHLLVEDNGPGMDRALIDRVLDPFFTATGRPEASGLGMFISYSIIKNHGGDMEIESSPGAGFKTRISMPVSNHLDAQGGSSPEDPRGS